MLVIYLRGEVTNNDDANVLEPTEESQNSTSLQKHFSNLEDACDPLKDETPYSCEVCNKGFAQKPDLQKHYSAHIVGKPFVCNLCDLSFMRESALTAHRCVSDKYRFVCDICRKAFEDESALQSHLAHHEGEKPYFCEVCNIRFMWKYSLKRHFAKNKCETAFGCCICGSNFSQMSSLDEHYKTQCFAKFGAQKEITDKRKPHVCEVCGKGFGKKNDLRRHFPIHTGERAFTCNPCGKRYTNRSTLLMHCRRFHNGERPYSCDKCKKSFLRKKELDTHQYIHTGSKPYSCKECKTQFCHRKSLERHVRQRICAKGRVVARPGRKRMIIAHYEEVAKSLKKQWEIKCKSERNVTADCSSSNEISQASEEYLPFSCDLCSKGFQSENDLTQHYFIHKPEVKRVHPMKESKPHSCDVCGRRFRLKKDLQAHAFVHTVLNDFGCQTCNQTFAEEADFKTHACDEPNKKLFICDICNEAFKEEHKYQKHSCMQTAAEMWFRCNVCDKAFHLEDSLRKHRLVHSEVKGYTCDTCNKSFIERSDLVTHKLLHRRENLQKSSHGSESNTGSKEHRCEICGRGFSKNCHLKRHYFTHAGEKRHFCNECGKGFLLQSGLKGHYCHKTRDEPPGREKSLARKRDLNVKQAPYVCNTCDKRFSLKRSLIKHSASHVSSQSDDSLKEQKFPKGSVVVIKVT